MRIMFRPQNKLKINSNSEVLDINMAMLSHIILQQFCTYPLYIAQNVGQWMLLTGHNKQN